ncbi:hypothetical protein [Mesoplasma photuris]|uniref:hypothetical protein n=1 Tax=Mesoplasma photuris TaxID=217731 RepID=UPI0004E19020|nr:hypothetical protein [Mesoplasma photuris]
MNVEIINIKWYSSGKEFLDDMSLFKINDVIFKIFEKENFRPLWKNNLFFPLKAISLNGETTNEKILEKIFNNKNKILEIQQRIKQETGSEVYISFKKMNIIMSLDNWNKNFYFNFDSIDSEISSLSKKIEDLNEKSKKITLEEKEYLEYVKTNDISLKTHNSTINNINKLKEEYAHEKELAILELEKKFSEKKLILNKMIN